MTDRLKEQIADFLRRLFPTPEPVRIRIEEDRSDRRR